MSLQVIGMGINNIDFNKNEDYPLEMVSNILGMEANELAQLKDVHLYQEIDYIYLPNANEYLCKD